MKSQNNQFFRAPPSWQRPPDGASCFTLGTIFTFRHHAKKVFIHVLSSKGRPTFILARDLRGLVPKAHPKYLSRNWQETGREIIVYRILPKKSPMAVHFPNHQTTQQLI